MGRRSAPRLVRRRRHRVHGRPARHCALGIFLNSLAIAALVVVALVGAAPPPTPQVMETGKAVYEQTCAACHGATGQGDGPVAFAVKPPPRNLVKDPFKAGDSVEKIFATVTNGLANTRMVGYPQLTDAERWGLAYYVRSFRLKK